MSYIEAILLGLVQALTEFLPVSSSGHLVLAQAWFGERGVDVLFNVLLHTATMVAVLVYFRREIWEIVRGLFGTPGSTPPFAGFEGRAVLFLLLANVPTGVIGLLIERFLEEQVSSPGPVGLFLVATGCLLWWGRGRDGTRGIAEMTAVDALIVGIAQGVAVLPGLSRSGLTIVTAVLIGLDRLLAVKFSLLVSIPAIAGATLLRALDIETGTVLALGPYTAGMLVAGLAGYGAIHIILILVERHTFFRFAFYLWPVGVLAMLSPLFLR